LRLYEIQNLLGVRRSVQRQAQHSGGRKLRAFGACHQAHQALGIDMRFLVELHIERARAAIDRLDAELLRRALESREFQQTANRGRRRTIAVFELRQSFAAASVVLASAIRLYARSR